jgi:iron-sulfur cluster protein
MDLEQIIKSERIKVGKQAMNVAFTNYRINRDIAFQKINKDEVKKELKKIKEFSIANLEELKKKTIKNLQDQNIKIFEAKDAKDACKIISNIIPKNETAVKAKSNTIDEIGLKEFLKKRNRIVETDCGDFIVQICDEESSHPVLPALHIPLKRIVEKVEQKFKVKLKEDPDEIKNWVKKHLRKEILSSNIGLTGANAISSDGSIFILENEGNISLVTRIPEKHIIVAGIDKIVPTSEDALKICKALAVWGTGACMPAYINIISSPSKTADIQSKTLFGMHGTKEVYLILVDNGRSEIIKRGFSELLYCANCGSCLYFCPVYRQILDNYGLHYYGGRGIGMTYFQEGMEKAFERGLYYCTTCQICKENCPFEIDLPELIKKLRKKSVENDFEMKVNERMMENIRSMGNPFGEEVKEGKIPKELFCC